jgi:drug/metabolite transporter (DMT)-like permease
MTSMSALATLLWAANLVCDVAGQLAFKAAAISERGLENWERWRLLAANKWIWVGVGAFVAEFVLWLAFLSLVQLSLAVVVGAADIVAVMIGGRLCFDEAITSRRALGATLIVAGVVLVGWS